MRECREHLRKKQLLLAHQKSSQGVNIYSAIIIIDLQWKMFQSLKS